MDNDRLLNGVFKAIIYIACFSFMIFFVNKAGFNDERYNQEYLEETFPDITVVYPNIVTEEKNDFFMIDRLSETMYYSIVLKDENDNYSHQRKVITGESNPALLEMSRVSLNQSTDDTIDHLYFLHLIERME